MTDNGGVTWSRLYSRVGAVYAGCTVSTKVAWAAGKRGAARTTDGGRTWKVMLHAPDISHIQFVDAGHGWAFTADGQTVYRTADVGTSWEQFPYPPWNPYAARLPLNFLDSSLGLALDVSANIIWRTMDSGASWEAYAD